MVLGWGSGHKTVSNDQRSSSNICTATSIIHPRQDKIIAPQSRCRGWAPPVSVGNKHITQIGYLVP